MTTSRTTTENSQHGMIHIHRVDPSIIINLRYKTNDNITNNPIYPVDMPVLLRPSTAKRLKHANELIKKSGYLLMVWDAYRPQSAQIALWDASGHNSNFVANPHTKPSLHTSGVAVDLTLALPDGSPVEMPTSFDNFSEKASLDYVHPDPKVRRNLRILKEAMSEAGFQCINAEWWHFLDPDFQQYSTIPSIQY